MITSIDDMDITVLKSLVDSGIYPFSGTMVMGEKKTEVCIYTKDKDGNYFGTIKPTNSIKKLIDKKLE